MQWPKYSVTLIVAVINLTDSHVLNNVLTNIYFIYTNGKTKYKNRFRLFR